MLLTNVTLIKKKHIFVITVLHKPIREREREWECRAEILCKGKPESESEGRVGVGGGEGYAVQGTLDGLGVRT